MPDLVLHGATQRELKQHAVHPTHALIIVGAEGSGKMAVAKQLACDILHLPDADALEQYQYARIIAPDGQSISIDPIRELLHFTKLKIAGKHAGTQRIIIVDQAHAMTIEAQNALLKLLEEPPAGTMLLLTANSTYGLLPTIRSRSQQLQVKQPERQQLFEYFTTHGFDKQKVQQAYFMSGGLPGLMHALLVEADHPLIAAVQQARGLLQTKMFERLAQVDALAKQKPECLRVLFVLQQMAHAALEQAASKNSDTPLRQWQKVLTAAYSAEQSLLASAQPKLVLTNLMLVL
jgi:hypothetical protein